MMKGQEAQMMTKDRKIICQNERESTEILIPMRTNRNNE